MLVEVRVLSGSRLTSTTSTCSMKAGKVNRVKRIIAGVLVSTVALTGIGGVANASEAAAFTKSQCIATHSYWGQPIWSCYYDFNWWEETFQRKSDGYYTSPRAIWA